MLCWSFGIILALIQGVLGHPQCLDGKPPFSSSPQLQFCTEYEDVGCCTADQDANIRARLVSVKLLTIVLIYNLFNFNFVTRSNMRYSQNLIYLISNFQVLWLVKDLTCSYAYVWCLFRKNCWTILVILPCSRSTRRRTNSVLGNLHAWQSVYSWEHKTQY